MSDDLKKRLTIIKAVIVSSLPETNKRVIKSLLFLLYAIQVRRALVNNFKLTFDVQRKSKTNKMTSENLSVVIGPSILRKDGTRHLYIYPLTMVISIFVICFIKNTDKSGLAGIRY
jgi:hypothetical protein